MVWQVAGQKVVSTHSTLLPSETLTEPCGCGVLFFSLLGSLPLLPPPSLPTIKEILATRMYIVLVSWGPLPRAGIKPRGRTLTQNQKPLPPPFVIPPLLFSTYSIVLLLVLSLYDSVSIVRPPDSIPQRDWGRERHTEGDEEEKESCCVSCPRIDVGMNRCPRRLVSSLP